MLAIDLFCGLGGWTDGLLAEGWQVIGFDIERHDYGTGGYPAQLVLQDVMTIHGRQFKDAALIVASPPCQEFSYMAMPWSLAKEKAVRIRADAAEQKRLTALFDACFRIQREASEAAGHHIPLIVENVRGAIPWVGRSRWNYGSYHLWGDVQALMPMTRRMPFKGGDRNIGRANGEHIWDTAFKVPGFRFDGNGGSFQSASVEHTGHKSHGLNWSDQSKRGQDFTRVAGRQIADGMKNDGGSWFGIDPRGNRVEPNNARDELKTAGLVQQRDGHGHTRHLTNQREHDHVKQGGISGPRTNGKGDKWSQDGAAQSGSKSKARKAASAAIAKIPFVLSRYIAAHFKPAI